MFSSVIQDMAVAQGKGRGLELHSRVTHEQHGLTASLTPEEHEAYSVFFVWRWETKTEEELFQRVRLLLISVQGNR